MSKRIIFTILAGMALLAACKEGSSGTEAYGNFESDEVIVSGQASGQLISLHLAEGQVLHAGDIVGCVDTMNLHYRKLQLLASQSGVASRNSGIAAQVSVLEEQRDHLLKEQARMSDLFKKSAVPQKQLDDISSSLRVVEEQIKEAETQNPGVVAELTADAEQLHQIEDAIDKSLVRAPFQGTVLTQYAHLGEVTMLGRPIFKLADLDTMHLRVYISEQQLASLHLGQTVKVHIDDGQKSKELSGTVEWIASEAEFTPKVIQTKEERVNLVYALKVKVKNDGSLKIGMPADISLH